MMFFMDGCNKVTEQASDYLDGNMSLPKRLKMRIHLLICNHCRNFVHQLEITIGAIKGLGCTKPVSDEDVEDQVKKLIEARKRE